MSNYQNKVNPFKLKDITVCGILHSVIGKYSPVTTIVKLRYCSFEVHFEMFRNTWVPAEVYINGEKILGGAAALNAHFLSTAIEKCTTAIRYS